MRVRFSKPVKEAVILIGIDAFVVDVKDYFSDSVDLRNLRKYRYRGCWEEGIETVKPKTLRKVGKFLTEEVGMYEGFDIVKTAYVSVKEVSYASLPFLSAEGLSECCEKLLKEKVLSTGSCYDVIGIVRWEPGLQKGNFYARRYQEFACGVRGTASTKIPIISYETEEEACTGTLHELVEKITPRMLKCEDENCCMYFDKETFSHQPKPGTSLCENCLKVVEEIVEQRKSLTNQLFGSVHQRISYR